MLILSRKANESIVIEMEGSGEPIEIIVTEMTANQVRLGIEAPRGCKIWRKELLMTIQQNKEAAARKAGPGARDMVKKIAPIRNPNE